MRHYGVTPRDSGISNLIRCSEGKKLEPVKKGLKFRKYFALTRNRIKLKY